MAYAFEAPPRGSRCRRHAALYGRRQAGRWLITKCYFIIIPGDQLSAPQWLRRVRITRPAHRKKWLVTLDVLQPFDNSERDLTAPPASSTPAAGRRGPLPPRAKPPRTKPGRDKPHPHLRHLAKGPRCSGRGSDIAGRPGCLPIWRNASAALSALILKPPPPRAAPPRRPALPELGGGDGLRGLERCGGGHVDPAAVRAGAAAQAAAEAATPEWSRAALPGQGGNPGGAHHGVTPSEEHPAGRGQAGGREREMGGGWGGRWQAPAGAAVATARGLAGECLSVAGAQRRLPSHRRLCGACNIIEAPWLVNGGRGASLRHHNQPAPGRGGAGG
jgi:hypothetical protein